VLIDWFTICAQVINFLILVWLLRRYLYKPVLAAIDAREKKVAAKIADAESQEAKAKGAGEALRQRSAAFDGERVALMQKAMEEGAAERGRLMESARKDSQLLRDKLTQALAAERAELGRQLALRTQVEVFALTRKVLADLAGMGLEDRMIDVFVDRLAALPHPERSAQATPRTVRMRSAHDLSTAGRTKLEAAIRERLGDNAVIGFETASELVCGLELAVDGVKLAWSAEGYLSTLAKDTALLAETELAVASEAPANVH
jgi:F-type H+-transporting ATPase subunit b